MAALDRRNVARVLVGAGLIGHAIFLPISIAGMQIALGVAAVGLLLASPRPLETPLDWPALAFVLIAICSDLLSPYGMPPLAAATLWRSMLGFFIVAHGLRVANDPRAAAIRLLYCCSLSVVIVALVAFLQYWTGFDPLHALGLRAQSAWVDAPGVPGRFGAMGFFTSRLTFGHNVTVLVSLGFGTLVSGTVPRRQLWLVGCSVLLGTVAVALTFDRAAYLGLGVAGLVIAALVHRSTRRVVAGVAVALCVLASLQPAIRSRAISAFSTRANSDRIFIWSRALEIIRDHPLHGVGFARYPEMCSRYYDRVDPTFFMRTWAHNLELSTLAETGPFGLAALLWLFGAALVAPFLRVRQRHPLALGGLAALCAWLTIAQVHDIFYDSMVMYALWFAIALALSDERTAPATENATPHRSA